MNIKEIAREFVSKLAPPLLAKATKLRSTTVGFVHLVNSAGLGWRMPAGMSGKQQEQLVVEVNKLLFYDKALKLLEEIVEITDSDDHRPLEAAVERARRLIWLTGWKEPE